MNFRSMLARRAAALAFSASFAASFASFAQAPDAGPNPTEERAVTGFRAIELRGPLQVVLRQGTRERFGLTGDAAVLRSIETRVVDRAGVPTLEIGVARGGWAWRGFPWGRTPVTATIDLITLGALRVAGDGDVTGGALKTPALAIVVSGSGGVRLRGLDAESVTATVSGSGDVALAGRAGQLHISIAGSGDVDTLRLEADSVDVSVAGSGDARVTARQTLAVSVAGSGDVTYAGEASLTTRIAGSGSVRKLR